jgi:hypothetical protein
MNQTKSAWRMFLFACGTPDNSCCQPAGRTPEREKKEESNYNKENGKSIAGSHFFCFFCSFFSPF